MGGSGTVGGVTVRWAVETDVGLSRSVNEDAAFARPPAFLVADGMGGHEAGDVASTLVVSRFELLAPDCLASCDQVVEIIRAANEEVFLAGDAQPRDRAMGSTAVGLVLIDQGEPGWLLFNVGDSRAYRLNDGSLELLSVDHSYVQELVDAGQIGAQEARQHPQRNVITRAFGTEVSIEADIWLRELCPGERFLLCSDGLSGEVDEALITSRLLEHEDPEEAARRLVEDALAAGGHDNVTVVIVDLVDATCDPLGTTEPKPERAERVEEGPLGRSPLDKASGDEQLPVEGLIESVEIPSSVGASDQDATTAAEVSEPDQELITGVPEMASKAAPEAVDEAAVEDSDRAVEGLDTNVATLGKEADGDSVDNY